MPDYNIALFMYKVPSNVGLYIVVHCRDMKYCMKNQIKILALVYLYERVCILQNNCMISIKRTFIAEDTRYHTFLK